MTFRALQVGIFAVGLCPGMLLGMPVAQGIQLTRPADADPLSQNLLQATDLDELFSLETVAEELDASLEGILALQGLEFYANISSAPLRNNRACIRDSGNPSDPCGSRSTGPQTLALRAEDGALANEVEDLRTGDGALATESTIVRTTPYGVNDGKTALRTEVGTLENERTEARTDSGFLETELRAMDKASTETIITPQNQSSTTRASNNASLLAGGESLLSLDGESTKTAEEIREEEAARKERARQRREAKAERIEEAERNRAADMIANGALAGLVVVTIVSAVVYDVRGRIVEALSGRSHQPHQPVSHPHQSPLRR